MASPGNRHCANCIGACMFVPYDVIAYGHGRPQEGAGGHLTPWISTNFSHIVTVAPRVEIQMHFWKRG